MATECIIYIQKYDLNKNTLLKRHVKNARVVEQYIKKNYKEKQLLILSYPEAIKLYLPDTFSM